MAVVGTTIWVASNSNPLQPFFLLFSYLVRPKALPFPSSFPWSRLQQTPIFWLFNAQSRSIWLVFSLSEISDVTVLLLSWRNISVSMSLWKKRSVDLHPGHVGPLWFFALCGHTNFCPDFSRQNSRSPRQGSSRLKYILGLVTGFEPITKE